MSFAICYSSCFFLSKWPNDSPLFFFFLICYKEFIIWFIIQNEFYHQNTIFIIRKNKKKKKKSFQNNSGETILEEEIDNQILFISFQSSIHLPAAQLYWTFILLGHTCSLFSSLVTFLLLLLWRRRKRYMTIWNLSHD